MSGLITPDARPARNGLSGLNTVEFSYTNIAEAFPDVDPGIEPLGSLVLVQIRQAKMRSAGGIILNSDARETEHYNTQVAKVIALGPIAFKNRNTMEAWPEGAWCKPGDFVRVPKYNGDRWSVKFNFEDYEIDPDTRERHPKTATDDAIFSLFKDTALLGRVTGDPTKMRAFL